jgi:tetratricopeptide (TPR) repeat protein
MFSAQDVLQLFMACEMRECAVLLLLIAQVGRSLYLLGKHRAAVDVYDEALKLQDNDAELWLSKGLCAVQLRDYDRWAGALVAALPRAAADSRCATKTQHSTCSTTCICPQKWVVE